MYLVKRSAFLLWIMLSSFSIYAERTPAGFVITKVSPHVYIAHQGLVKRVNSTSTIIAGRDYLTVVEAQTDIFTAKSLIAEIRRKISKLPIKYLVFSHFHLDHILGAAAFLEENPSLIIVAHEKVAEHIRLHSGDEQKSWAGAMKQKSMEARQSASSAGNTQKKSYLLETANELEAYSRDIESSQIVAPSLTFSDSLNLGNNEMEIQLKFLGAAHTPGDIVALIRPDRVLVTGDIVHDFEPLLWDANPESWIGVLDKIKQMNFDFFVGGHGDVDKGKKTVIAWQNYLKELKAKTMAAIKNGMSLEAFRASLDVKSFASLQNGYGERIQKFRTTYMDYLTGPLNDAIKDEAGYMWKFYSKN